MPGVLPMDRELRRAVARLMSERPGGPLPRISVADGRATIVCRSSRHAGAAAALALAERVGALFRSDAIRFGAPSVDLDGRDPAWFRAVVTVPLRPDRGPIQPSRRQP